MIAAPCTPYLTGNSNVTDDTGTAYLHDLTVLSGPPGIYSFDFTAGDGIYTSGETEVTSEVYSVRARVRCLWRRPDVPN